jgi:hypothetical protein
MYPSKVDEIENQKDIRIIQEKLEKLQYENLSQIIIDFHRFVLIVCDLDPSILKYREMLL